MDKETLYIVIPAYNEEDNLETLVKEWHPIVESYGNSLSRLLVINDGSTDSTSQILESLSEQYPMLAFNTKPNGGHGSTLIFGYSKAIAEGADWIFQTDSDGQTVADEFLAFWTERPTYDAIIGVRKQRGDGLTRKFVEFVLCKVLKHYFGVSLTDANAPFRLMRASLVARYLDMMPADYNLPNAVMTALFVRNGERVRFREITFKPRQGGKNTINIRRIVSIGWHALDDFKTIAANADLRTRQSSGA
jgi:glycosyltransferase involved in cell wall biosynthesis